MAPLLIDPGDHHGELVFLVPAPLGYGGLEVLVPIGGKWRRSEIIFHQESILLCKALAATHYRLLMPRTPNRKRMFLKLRSTGGCHYITGTGRSMFEI